MTKRLTKDDDDGNVFNLKRREALFIEVARVLFGQPVDEVIPVLITAAARALIMNAGGDVKKLADGFDKFMDLTHGQIGDMLNQDLDEAKDATKQ